MTTASKTSVSRRIRTFAVAGTFAITLMLPLSPAILADTGVETPQTVTTSGLSVSVESIDQLSGLTAIVVTTNDGVPMLAEPAAGATVVAEVPDGTTVNLRVDMVDTVIDAEGTRWWPVEVSGDTGWIDGLHLTQATTADGDVVSSSLVAYEHTREATAHSTATVFGNGEQVNVRLEPSTSSDIVTKAADGEVISLRIDMVDTVIDDQGTRWWPVTVNGVPGWISGYYLKDSGDAPTSRPGDAPPTVILTPTTSAGEGTVAPTEDGSDGFEAGEFAQVFTGDGTAVNVRSAGAPDAAVVDSLNDGEVVRIVSGPIAAEGSSAGWYEVTNANATGFVDGDFLVSSVEAVETATAVPSSATEQPQSEEEEATSAAATITPGATTVPTTVPSTDVPSPAPTQAASSSEFIYPLANYRRTQGFGCSNLGFYSYDAEFGCPVHNGLDLAAPAGTAILASAGGTVITAGWCNCGLGYYVEIDHGDGVHSVYGHMASQPYVRAGEAVSQGDVIGPVGSTGISTGPHVHFMIKVNGSAKNPEDYLP